MYGGQICHVPESVFPDGGHGEVHAIIIETVGNGNLPTVVDGVSSPFGVGEGHAHGVVARAQVIDTVQDEIIAFHFDIGEVSPHISSLVG